MMNDHEQNQQGQDNRANSAEGNSNMKENTDTSAIYLGDSSLQTKPEFEKDKNSISSRKETITSFGVDDLQSNSDGAAGTDRAGTTERKTYGDVELNKGLESQAKDEES